MSAVERVCLLCGRTIREGAYGSSNYAVHVEACERRTPAQRAAAARLADEKR